MHAPSDVWRVQRRARHSLTPSFSPRQPAAERPEAGELCRDKQLQPQQLSRVFLPAHVFQEVLREAGSLHNMHDTHAHTRTLSGGHAGSAELVKSLGRPPTRRNLLSAAG